MLMSNPGIYLPWRGLLFLAGNSSVSRGFSLEQERKIPGNPEMPEAFPGQ
jgi:hypothetical protein